MPAPHADVREAILTLIRLLPTLVSPDHDQSHPLTVLVGRYRRHLGGPVSRFGCTTFPRFGLEVASTPVTLTDRSGAGLDLSGIDLDAVTNTPTWLLYLAERLDPAIDDEATLARILATEPQGAAWAHALTADPERATRYAQGLTSLAGVPAGSPSTEVDDLRALLRRHGTFAGDLGYAKWRTAEGRTFPVDVSETYARLNLHEAPLVDQKTYLYAIIPDAIFQPDAAPGALTELLAMVYPGPNGPTFWPMYVARRVPANPTFRHLCFFRAEGGLDPDPSHEEGLTTRGQAALRALVEANHPTTGTLREGEGQAVVDFPAWFLAIQDRLCLTTVWTSVEEQAQEVLHDYACWWVRQRVGWLPGSLEVFFRYLGRGEANVAAALEHNRVHPDQVFRTAADLGGVSGSVRDWCQDASTRAMRLAFAEHSPPLGLQGSWDAWNQEGGRQREEGRARFLWGGRMPASTSLPEVRPAAWEAPLRPGDVVQYLYAGCQIGGHCVTVVLDLGAQGFLHVSGNTGAVGAVRIAVSQRRTPPEGFDVNKAVANPQDPAYRGGSSPADGVTGVWVYSVSRVGDVFRAAERSAGAPAAELATALQPVRARIATP